MTGGCLLLILPEVRIPKGVLRKVLLLFLFGFSVRLVLAWLPEKYLFYLVYDDAYYYFAIARNFASRGMLSADGITLTNGFHPLWLFTITPIYFFFAEHPWLSIHFALSFCALLDMAAAFLLYKILDKLGRPKIGFWVAAFYLIHPYVLQYTMSGLETALNSFLLALLVYASLSATWERLSNGWFGLGTVCGLALLARTDNLFAVGALLGYLLWRDRRVGPLAKTAFLAILIAAPWLGYNLASFGTVVQTSGKTFPWLAHQQYLKEYGTYFTWRLLPYALKSGFYSFALYAYHYGNWILTLLVGGILAFRLAFKPKGQPDVYRPLLWTLAGACLFLFVHLCIRWSMRPWYAQSAFVLTLPAVALACERLNRYVAAVGVLSVLYFAGLVVWSPGFFHRIERLKVMLEIINRDLPAGDRVGAFNSGYLQYFTDKKVINLDGFVNNEVLSHYQKEKGLQYFRKMDIKWLIDYTLFVSAIFGPYFGAGAEKALEVKEHFPDLVASKNNIVVVAVLPDGRIIPPERRLPIFREWAVRRQWGPIPWPRLVWE